MKDSSAGACSGRSAVMTISQMIRRLLAVLLALVSLARAQNLSGSSDDDLPPRPAGLVLDDSRIFAREPERLKALSDRLEELRRKHGFSLYLVMRSSFIGASPAKYAQDLQDRWIGDGSGWVVLVETDSGRTEVGRPKLKTIELEPGRPIPNDSPKDIAHFDQSRILQELQPELSGVTDRGERVEKTINGLTTAITRLLDEREAAPPGTGMLRTAILGIGLLALCALVVLLGRTVLRRTDAKHRGRLIFPRVHVGARLGAPYGGGKISCRTFEDPAPR